MRPSTATPSEQPMIVLLESVHDDALSLLDDHAEVTTVDDPADYIDGLDRDRVRAIVTRGPGTPTQTNTGMPSSTHLA